ncbi:MAG: biotin--[acetyl-CoA-carboxylase] ligase [Prevotella sp.]|nr:biotin--[acetyl-CoA-carboxylase] ligase [Prevotella sp.]MCM1074892.1 biotin--[acetyl-CoA-carboxylase] ligase [Ruminococcus sp.]
MNVLHFNTLPSTYTYIAENAANMASGTVVTADYQTAGRGQRGNTWESQAGKNLLFAMLLRMTDFPVRSQFLISEAMSLAIVKTLRDVCALECKVKWPNDIYTSDRKICGILISHSVEAARPGGEAHIAHSVLSAGINLNQTEFLSDAPNPVSAIQLNGRQTNRDTFLNELISNLQTYINRLKQADTAAIHSEYMSTLWRADGAPHPFYDVLTGQRFNATIYAVEPLGHLVLRTPDAQLRRYAFKEITWLKECEPPVC